MYFAGKLVYLIVLPSNQLAIKATKNTERLKFQDFNICPNILHVDADAEVIAIALLH